jgi:hypothetical protein
MGLTDMAEPDYSKFRSIFGIPGKSGDLWGRPLKREPSKKLTAFEAGQVVRAPLDMARSGTTAAMETVLPSIEQFAAGVWGDPPGPTPPSTAVAVKNAVDTKAAGGKAAESNGQWDVLPKAVSPVSTVVPAGEGGQPILRRGNTYSNQGVAGLDSIDNARGPSNPAGGVPEFLAGLKHGDLSLLNPQAAWDSRAAGGGGFYVSPGNARTGGTRPNADGTMPGGGFEGLVPGRVATGGGGMIPPEISDAITGLADQGPTPQGAGIVDIFRRRQLRKQYMSTIAGAVSALNARANTRAADASLMRAQNELPLALMQIGTQRQNAIDTNATHRYGYDTAAKSAANRDAFDLARFLPQMKRDEWGNQLYEQGDRAAAQELWTAGRFPPVPRNPATLQIPGGVFSIGADGRPSYYSQQDLENMRPGMPSAAEIKKHADDVRAGR